MTGTIRRLAAAALILTCLMGADGPKGCKTSRPGDVDTNRPDKRQPNPLRERVAYIEAHGDRRYQVIVVTHRAGETGLIDRSDNWVEHPEAGKYKQKLKYESGLRIVIVVTVKKDPNDPNLNALSCLIDDGGRAVAQAGPNLAQCELTTNR